ncbi:hypothetical protein RND81_04G044700 [Saponaria officinalis]|uniref:SHSP domain-containing protein n=1 Tax=Saponaria officinalis TaxID=3572 RepID=A0AAW1LJB1_SAPOF
MAMSMRSRGAAAAARRSRTGVRPVYDDFKPASELKHEEGVDVLLFHLPGFVKEQIRIIAESKGILRVHGERLIANNKWSRFQEEVKVPEDCNLSEIRAKFENDILKITMPKNIINKKQNIPHIIEKETNKVNNEPSSMHEKPQISHNTNNDNNYPKNESPPQPKKLIDDDIKAFVESKDVGNEGMTSKSVVEKTNEDKIGHEENEEEKEGVKNEGYGLSKLKNLTKSHVTRRLDEDRQLLMNMGAAILVIMALGASISYSLGSGEYFH